MCVSKAMPSGIWLTNWRKRCHSRQHMIKIGKVLGIQGITYEWSNFDLFIFTRLVHRGVEPVSFFLWESERVREWEGESERVREWESERVRGWEGERVRGWESERVRIAWTFWRSGNPEASEGPSIKSERVRKSIERGWAQMQRILAQITFINPSV
jgi:hypothetical protein